MQDLPEETLCSHFVTTLNITFETDLCMGGWRLCEWEWKPQHPHPSQQSTKSLPCLNHGWNILQSCTSHTRASWRALILRKRSHSFTCYQLVFTSFNDESPVRPSGWCPQHSSTNASSPAHRSEFLSSQEDHNKHHYCTPTPNTEQFFTVFNNVAWDDVTTPTELHFPTAPLDDKVWSEDSILDGQLCIHETPHEQNHQCSCPCPYRDTAFKMDLPQSTPQDIAVLNYELMDFSDISSDLPDIMMTTSDNDIPDLENISYSEHLINTQHRVWFA